MELKDLFPQTTDLLMTKVVLWHAENSKIAKSFGPCQPAQADKSRYFSQINEASFSQIMAPTMNS